MIIVVVKPNCFISSNEEENVLSMSFDEAKQFVITAIIIIHFLLDFFLMGQNFVKMYYCARFFCLSSVSIDLEL